MKIVKDKQFFTFYLDDGKTVKYDLSTGQVIGKKGGIVNSINTQLRGYDIQDILDSFEDKGYRNYFKEIYRSINSVSKNITNMGTLLSHARKHRIAEQYYIIGIQVPIEWDIPISQISKGLLNICKSHDVSLSKSFLSAYKIFPNEINWAFNHAFNFLTSKHLVKIFISRCDRYDYITRAWDHSYRIQYFQKNGYDYKALLVYLDNLAMFEGLEDVEDTLREMCDYINMATKISPKFEKYPRNFLTTHTITARNYNRFEQAYNEEQFKQHYTSEYNTKYKDFIFIYPASIQDIKDEAVCQSSCVASYIQKVIDGTCHIIFMRDKDTPDKSLVTLEIQDNQIVQAKGRYNREVTPDEREAIDYFNNKFATRKEAIAV